MAEKDEKIAFQGEIIEAYRGGMYRTALEIGHETLGYTSGKMRHFRIRIVPCDHIRVELTPYDLTRGRIVRRHRDSRLRIVARVLCEGNRGQIRG
jgi:translation initiation factor IF-1